MNKPFLSFDDQINYLQNEKNLTIPDKEYTLKTLKQIGYFGLIGGYKNPFQNPTTKKYKDGTTFDEIVDLYKFDENLRELFFKYIMIIEKNIRSLLSYYFTEKHGQQQNCYLDGKNYCRNKDTKELIVRLDNLANKNNDYDYINHQRVKYGNVPLWVVVCALPLGSLSKFYGCLTPDLKVKISKNFDKVNEKQLEQYLSVITKFRNVCAHNERLFSYQTKNAIPNTALHEKLNIPKKGTEYIYGKRDLFSLVISFRYLLLNEDFKKFQLNLNKIINHYLKNARSLTETSLYSYMGFPINWKKITSLKKQPFK